MKSSLLVPTRWLFKLLTDCRNHGIEEKVLFRQAGLEDCQIMPNQSYVPVDQVDNIMLAFPEVKDEPHCYIRMAADLKLSRIEPLDCLIPTAMDLSHAIDLFDRYRFLVHPYAKFKIMREERSVTIQYIPTNEMSKSRQYLELFMGSMLTYGRLLTGRDIRPLQTCFQYAKPGYAEFYEDLFRSPLVFDADYSEMRFDRDEFSHLLVCANPRWNQWAESQVKNLVFPPESVTEKVSQIILNDSQVGMLSMDAVAGRLQTSRRTLHRQLTENGTSFNQIRDKVLYQKAISLMKDLQITIQHVADQTGFSELSAFHRAFKRWSGLTPSQYRKNLKSGLFGNNGKLDSR
ncbi:AraC family transcriptional regulator [bacterium]|nr:AraC family transcriptional regulator [bacterium]